MGRRNDSLDSPSLSPAQLRIHVVDMQSLFFTRLLIDDVFLPCVPCWSLALEQVIEQLERELDLPEVHPPPQPTPVDPGETGGLEATVSSHTSGAATPTASSAPTPAPTPAITPLPALVTEQSGAGMPAELEHVLDTAASPEPAQVATSHEHNNGHDAEAVDKEMKVSKDLTIAIVGAVSAISVAAISMGILVYFQVYKRARKDGKYVTIKSSFSTAGKGTLGMDGQSTFSMAGSKHGRVRNPILTALPALLFPACLSSLGHAGAHSIENCYQQ